MKRLAFAFIALLIAAGGGWYLTQPPSVRPVAALPLCGFNERNTSTKTCIVDGDTLWLQGTPLRLLGVDTLESRTNVCGGFEEIDLARQATDRLQALLNESPWSVAVFGKDNTGMRYLATITVEGRDVGEILIAERLARVWPDGDEFWCG